MEIRIIKNGEVSTKSGNLSIAVVKPIKGFIEELSENDSKIAVFSIGNKGYELSLINYEAMLDFEMVNGKIKDNCLKNGELVFICDDGTFIKISSLNGFLIDYKKKSYNTVVEIESKSKEKLNEISKALVVEFVNGIVNQNKIYSAEYIETKTILETLSKSLSGIKPSTGYDFYTNKSDEVESSISDLIIASLGKALHNLYSGNILSRMEMQIIASATSEDKVLAMNLYNEYLLSKNSDNKAAAFNANLAYIKSLEEDVIKHVNLHEKTTQKM